MLGAARSAPARKRKEEAAEAAYDFFMAARLAWVQVARMRSEAELFAGFEFPNRASDAKPDGGELEVTVIFTNPEGTLAALKTARDLARDLRARVRVLVIQVVPYPLPLDDPPVPVAFTERRFDALASNAAPGTRVQVYLCRDRWQVLRDFIRPGSLLVIGGKKRCWSTQEARLAKWLRSKGHRVIFSEEGRTSKSLRI